VDAGPDASTSPGQEVGFSGQGPTGTGVSYTWKVVPDGASQPVAKLTGKEPSWIPAQSGIFQVRLQVTDSAGKVLGSDGLTLAVQDGFGQPSEGSRTAMTDQERQTLDALDSGGSAWTSLSQDQKASTLGKLAKRDLTADQRAKLVDGLAGLAAPGGWAGNAPDLTQAQAARLLGAADNLVDEGAGRGSASGLTAEQAGQVLTALEGVLFGLSPVDKVDLLKAKEVAGEILAQQGADGLGRSGRQQLQRVLTRARNLALDQGLDLDFTAGAETQLGTANIDLRSGTGTARLGSSPVGPRLILPQATKDALRPLAGNAAWVGIAGSRSTVYGGLVVDLAVWSASGNPVTASFDPGIEMVLPVAEPDRRTPARMDGSTSGITVLERDSRKVRFRVNRAGRYHLIPDPSNAPGVSAGTDASTAPGKGVLLSGQAPEDGSYTFAWAVTPQGKAQPVHTATGREMVWVPENTGMYTARVRVLDDTGAEVGRDTVSVAVQDGFGQPTGSARLAPSANEQDLLKAMAGDKKAWTGLSLAEKVRALAAVARRDLGADQLGRALGGLAGLLAPGGDPKGGAALSAAQAYLLLGAADNLLREEAAPGEAGFLSAEQVGQLGDVLEGVLAGRSSLHASSMLKIKEVAGELLAQQNGGPDAADKGHLDGNQRARLRKLLAAVRKRALGQGTVVTLTGGDQAGLAVARVDLKDGSGLRRIGRTPAGPRVVLPLEVKDALRQASQVDTVLVGMSSSRTIDGGGVQVSLRAQTAQGEPVTVEFQPGLLVTMPVTRAGQQTPVRTVTASTRILPGAQQGSAGGEIPVVRSSPSAVTFRAERFGDYVLSDVQAGSGGSHGGARDCFLDSIL